MAKARFKLRTDITDSRLLSAIYLVYQNGRRETFFTTGKKTNIDSFNKGNNHEPIKPTCKDAKSLNIALRAQFARLTKLIDTYYLAENKYPPNEWVKQQWNGVNDEQQNLFDLFDSFITHQQTKGTSSVSYGTVLNYKKVKNNLLEFTGGEVHYISDVTVDFVTRYNQWLLTEKNYLPNSVGENLKIIKTFLKWVDVTDKTIFKHLKGSNDKTWALYLTIEELKEISQFVSPYDETRDAFVLQCCLGVRYSDLKTIVSSKIIKEGSNFYYITKTKKTNKVIKVKLVDIAKAIIEKYGSDTNWIPEIGICNRNLKYFFKLFGFTDTIQITKGSGAYRKELLIPKHDLISTHTARRTYVNIMRKLKVDDSTISTITGQSLAVLRGYYHPSDSDTNEAMEQLNNSLNLAF